MKILIEPENSCLSDWFPDIESIFITIREDCFKIGYRPCSSWSEKNWLEIPGNLSHWYWVKDAYQNPGWHEKIPYKTNEEPKDPIPF